MKWNRLRLGVVGLVVLTASTSAAAAALPARTTAPHARPVNAKVRVVNLYVPSGEEAGAAVDVIGGFDAKATGTKRLATVEYGEVSPTFKPIVTYQPTGRRNKVVEITLSFYPAGKKAARAKLITKSEDVSPGDQLTMVILPGDPDSPGASLQTLDERAKDKTQGLPQAQSGEALVFADAAATQYFEDEDGNLPAFMLGVVGQGCLTSAEDESGSGVTTNVGGTSVVEYRLDPGELELAAYPISDFTCEEEPEIPPVTLDAVAGERSYAFVYGTSITDLQLLIVPIP